jgi:hypothetical protein
VEKLVRHRLRQAFGKSSALPFNQMAEAWWERGLMPLGEALKQSFKLSVNPLKSPRVADEWESYLAEKRADHARFTHLLADTEKELNDRVYRLFDLTSEEIVLLQKEVSASMYLGSRVRFRDMQCSYCSYFAQESTIVDKH